jgi:hypothetical protein
MAQRTAVEEMELMNLSFVDMMVNLSNLVGGG